MKTESAEITKWAAITQLDETDEREWVGEGTVTEIDEHERTAEDAGTGTHNQRAPKVETGDSRGLHTIPSQPHTMELQACLTGHNKQDEGHPKQNNWVDKPSDRATMMAQRRNKRTEIQGVQVQSRSQWGP
jgi:hypothetical protein